MKKVGLKIFLEISNEEIGHNSVHKPFHLHGAASLKGFGTRKHVFFGWFQLHVVSPPLNVITTLNVIPTVNVIKINSKCNTNCKCNKNQP